MLGNIWYPSMSFWSCSFITNPRSSLIVSVVKGFWWFEYEFWPLNLCSEDFVYFKYWLWEGTRLNFFLSLISLSDAYTVNGKLLTKRASSDWSIESMNFSMKFKVCFTSLTVTCFLLLDSVSSGYIMFLLKFFYFFNIDPTLKWILLFKLVFPLFWTYEFC